MITALLHTVDTISFPLKWQSPDLAVQCVFFHQAVTRKLRHNYLRLSKQPTDAWRPSCLWIRDDKVRWRSERRKSCRMPCSAWSGNKTKGLLSKPVHAHWAEDLAFRPSAVHHQDREPATDRVWFRQMDGQTRVVCCREGRTVWNFTAGFETITQAWALCLHAD